MSSLPQNVTNDNYNIETKTQYRFRKKETTTSESSSMDGWELYDTKEETVSSTEKTVEVNEESLKTYQNNHNITIVKQECTSIHFDKYHCDKAESNGSYTVKLPDNNLNCPSGYTLHRNGYNALSNYLNRIKENGTEEEYGHNQKYTALVKNVKETKWNITYKENSTKKKTYYFQRWSEWESYQDNPITSSDSVEVETQKVYRYQKK